MKLLLFFCFVLLFGWLGGGVKNHPAKTSAEKNLVLTTNDTILFSSQIQPILVNHCSPCHFPGGKMYERLPFDKDTTIINHEAGVLRRIKGEDNDLIKAFIQQNKR